MVPEALRNWKIGIPDSGKLVSKNSILTIQKQIPSIYLKINRLIRNEALALDGRGLPACGGAAGDQGLGEGD